ncbi:MAG: hypothetical protein P4L69_15580, partial [Desulfosporosinus sp.]|nr:hypothetical protein [Desulfosporosinus sp.]
PKTEETPKKKKPVKKDKDEKEKEKKKTTPEPKKHQKKKKEEKSAFHTVASGGAGYESSSSSSSSDSSSGDDEPTPNRKAPGESILRVDRGRIKRAIESHQNRRDKRIEQAGEKRPTTTVVSMLTDELLEFWNTDTLSLFDKKFGRYMQQ